MNVVSDIIAQWFQILVVKRLILKLNRMEMGKVFFIDSASASHFCLCVCTIIIHIIYEWHAEARWGGGGGETVYGWKKQQLKNVGEALTLFISNYS